MYECLSLVVMLPGLQCDMYSIYNLQLETFKQKVRVFKELLIFVCSIGLECVNAILKVVNINENNK